MADLVNKIPVVVDGESAYDFRLKVNQAIAGVNEAFESINEEYQTIVETTEQYETLKADISRAQDEVENYVETVAKPEIKKYFADFIENGAEDLSTIQLRRNNPVVDSTGYLPEFWYKVIDGSGPLVTYAKLVSPSSTFASLKLSKNSNWTTGSPWTITGTATYNSSVIPSAVDVIGVMLSLEDGSYIVSEEIKNDNFSGVAPSGVTFTGIQPEYDAYSKTIFWTCGRVASWDEIEGGKITVNNIKVTDGVLTQTFNISLTLTAR